jgi:hypothetical protein
MNKRETKHQYKLLRAAIRRKKSKARNNRPRARFRRCDSCGGREQWCSCCQMWTKTCCVDYGTCMCS